MQEIFDLGNKHYNEQNYQEAANCFQKICDAIPNNAMIHHNLALCYYQLRDYENALKYFELPANLKSVETLVSRGVIYRDMGRYEEAIQDFAVAITQDPNSAGALSNYGNSLREYNLPLLAIPFLKKAQEVDPDFVNAHLNESISYLSAGDFLNGWKKYEYRWYYEKGHNIKPVLSQPEWRGEDIKDKTILVYAEQGLGDSIQFCRYLPMIAKLAKKVYYASKLPLTEFLQLNYPEVEVIPNTIQPLPYFDYHCALLNLPIIFQTTIDTIPCPDPYLKPVDKYVKSWNKKLKEKTKPRIGLIWRSNGEAWTSRIRNVPLDKLLTIVSDKYEFISLQYEPTPEEIKLLKKHKVKVFKDDLLSGLSSVSGLIANLDLMVTGDTYTAHMAPAMGIQTYVLLADYGVDWRWFIDRDDSPFYKNHVRLFRQPRFNDWDSSIAKVKSELNK